MLNLRVTQIKAPHLVVVEVNGDLQGGSCRLSPLLDADHTHVEFNWDVKTCKPWMNWFTTLTRPVFARKHAQVMRLGEQGLIRYVNAKFENGMEYYLVWAKRLTLQPTPISESKRYSLSHRRLN